MQQSKKTPSLPTFIAILVSAGISLPTLWLLESSIKYPLYLIEISLIMTIYYALGNRAIKLTFCKRLGTLEHLNLTLEILLIVAPLMVVVWSAAGLQGSLAQLVMALLVTSFLPGYVLLRLTNLDMYLSKLELLVLSHVLSYIFSGFLFFAFLPIDRSIRPMVMSMTYLFLGISSVIKHSRRRAFIRRPSFSRPQDILPLSIIIAFYVIAMMFLYPNLVLRSGLDNAVHYANSIVLARTPEFYSYTPYIFFHLFQANFLGLSNNSFQNTGSAIAFLSLILPLSFYITAKEYIGRADPKLPIVATSLFLFSNVSWIYFIYLKAGFESVSQASLLALTADKTYWGTQYGVYGLWYIPQTVAFTAILILFFLLKRGDLPRAGYFGLFSTLIAATYLTHGWEAILPILFLALYAVISKRNSLRIGDSIKSSLLSFLIVSTFYIILSFINVRFSLSFSLLFPLLLLAVALALSLTMRSFKLRWRARINDHHLVEAVTIGLIFLYSIGFVAWIVLLNDISMSKIGLTFPWFFYSTMLGVTGLLAILALPYIVKEQRLRIEATPIVIFLVFLFIAGRLMPHIQSSVYQTIEVFYGEERFVHLIKIFASMIAPIPIVWFIARLKNFNSTTASSTKSKRSHRYHMPSLTKKLTTLLLISVMVSFGITSSFLIVEYWHITNYSRISDAELEAMEHLKSIFDKEETAWLITASDASFSASALSTPLERLESRQFLYSATSPEYSLYFLYRAPFLSHPYLYLHTRDAEFLEAYKGRYVTDHLLPNLPIVFENSESTIYNISKTAPPLPRSNTRLVIPFDDLVLSSKQLLYIYDLLSLSQINYTTFYDLDDKALAGEAIILPFDPPPGDIIHKTLQDNFEVLGQDWTLISGSWQVQEGELIGGGVKKNEEGMIISIISAQNFTAHFNTKVIKGSDHNYAGLVYSWRDNKNYRYVNVYFNPVDGYIYVMFREIIDGVVTTIPQFPGVRTPVKWAPSDEYNVTVVVNGDLNEVLINGVKYASTDLKNVRGRLGLRCYTHSVGEKVAFKNLVVDAAIRLNIRSYDEYMEYLTSGGNLIIFNTDRIGAFGENLLSISGRELKVTSLQGPNTHLKLPYEIQVPIVELKQGNAQVVGLYVSASGESTIYAVKQNVGKGQLTYVNVKPVLQSMSASESGTPLYPMIGELLEILDLNLTKFQSDDLSWRSIFRNVSLKGNVTIDSTSILIPPVNLTKVSVDYGNGQILVSNVTALDLSGYDHISLRVTDVDIKEGKGFYAVVSIGGIACLEPHGSNVALTLWTDAEEFDISSIKRITMEGLKKIYMRTPNISAVGSALFKELYFEALHTDGKDFNVTGYTKFNVLLSDAYTVSDDFSIQGSFERIPPLVSYNEWSTFNIVAPWGFMLLPLFLLILLVYWSRENLRDVVKPSKDEIE